MEPQTMHLKYKREVCRSGTNLVEETEAHVVVGLLLLCSDCQHSPMQHTLRGMRNRKRTLLLLLSSGLVSSGSATGGGTTSGRASSSTTARPDGGKKILYILALKCLDSPVSANLVCPVPSTRFVRVPWRTAVSR